MADIVDVQIMRRKGGGHGMQQSTVYGASLALHLSEIQCMSLPLTYRS